MTKFCTRKEKTNLSSSGLCMGISSIVDVLLSNLSELELDPHPPDPYRSSLPQRSSFRTPNGLSLYLSRKAKIHATPKKKVSCMLITLNGTCRTSWDALSVLIFHGQSHWAIELHMSSFKIEEKSNYVIRLYSLFVLSELDAIFQCLHSYSAFCCEFRIVIIKNTHLEASTSTP